MTAADAQRLLPHGVVWSFAVVRDPLSRIQSEFRFQSRSGYRGRRLTQLGFSTWLRIVMEAARRDPRVFDNHIRPQSHIVPADAEVFRIERGLSPLLARLDEISGTCAPELSVPDGRKAYKRDVRPTRQDVALIEAYFAEDYARFGYPAPEPDAASSDLAAAARRAAAWTIAPAVNRLYFRGAI